MPEGFIPSHGGYQKLLSYQKAEIVYDATVYFCDHFIDRRSRTHDQMVQAARSGKQNIIEGSMASGTSKEMEIKLTNVARASLEELLADYRDFLRTKGHQIWEKDCRRSLFASWGLEAMGLMGPMRPIGFSFIETRPPEVVANIIICLIHQTNYLLDRQLKRLEVAFLEEGGLRERMTRARLEARKRGE